MTHQIITSGPAPAERPALPSLSSFPAFVLPQTHCAALRSKIITNQLEAATVALEGGLITAEQALLVLHEAGLEIGAE
jgi:hypothetical protein